MLQQLSIAMIAFLVAIGAIAAEPSPARRPQELYSTYCASCHSGGWQGAPVAYDEREWQPRLANGFDALFKNAKQGLNAMPAKGTCMNCTDEELTAVVKEMLKF